MNRRLICAILAALILISLVSGAALSVSAASDMKTSDACVQILKDMEGFVEYPMYDNGQYSVGYGSGCGKDDYPNGITEEEADALLRKYLADFEKSVNTFADRYSLSFTQSQFDALMLFSYNCGASWTTGDGEFRQAIIDGAAGNDLIYPMSLWSISSSKLNLHLVKRRLIEADMYLNGSYTNSKPASFTYVLFDNNGGTGDVKVQGYDYSLPAVLKPTPTRSGYRFLGWYTAEEGGSWVTNLTAAHSETTLYAQWQEGSGDAVNGTAANYQRSASRLGSLTIYATPGGTKTSGTVSADSMVQIVADYVDGSNTKWGKLSGGGWVILGSALCGFDSNQTQQPVKVTVTNNYINVRSGPGTSYEKVGMVNKGQELLITEVCLVGTELWGRFSGGWIILMYTDYDTAVGNGSDTIATGTVVNCKTLNVRSGPGLEYAVVGSIASGTKVSITETREANDMTWAKISNGWVSMDYISLDETEPDATEPSEPDTTQPSEPDATEPGEPEPSEPAEGETNATVVCFNTMNIRSGPGTFNPVVGSYTAGTRVYIYEQTYWNGQYWGRTDKGWVCMDYIVLDSQLPPGYLPDTGNDPEPGDTTPMYRLYNPNSGEHFYTGSTEERDDLVEAGWKYEGVAWNAPISGGDPVYRVFNPNSGDHHYTADLVEVETLTDLGWQYEGIAWNSAECEDAVPQYRLWNPNADLGSHHYTSSTEERDYLVSLGWVPEGIGWYGLVK